MKTNQRISDMKKILFFSLLALVLAAVSACSDDNADPGTGPKVSFTTFSYTLPNKLDSMVVVTARATAPMTADVTVPLSFLGAEAGTDFQASAEALVFRAGETDASVVITRKSIDTSKVLTVTMQRADGIRLGAVNYVPITFLGANIYSFEEGMDKLALTKEIALTIEDEKGSRGYLSNTDTVRVDVETTDGTTAEEGVDFEFVGGAKAIFPPMKYTGTVTLKFLQKREGHDVVVLKVADGQSLYGGNYANITVKIMGPSDLAGTWVYDRIANNAWLKDSWGADASLLIDGKPENDSFTLAGNVDDYTFTPNFQGKLKNYFTAPGHAVKEGTRREYLQEAGGAPPPRVELNVYRIDNVNLNISSTDRTIGKYRVGFHMALNEKTGAEELLMTIYEYKPTDKTPMDWSSSWADYYDMMAYSGDDPAMLTMPIRVAFTRAK